ncbi:---NA--- [Paramuricea clavata]|uniref:---NA n=1 Tax=Paramuricea clavata TaxID=317549 RepID=A0A6S7KCA0_PARCT|nr:---NA--- [Paramuricea clavata]
MEESSVVVGSSGKWRADLLDRPDTTKFPYSYKCIVENNCCLTKMSSLLNMTYSPPPDGECPPFGVIKPIQVDSAPNERSVTFNWQYDPDPEDTGFSFSVRGASPTNNLSIAARERIVRGLEPNKNYSYSYSILYGKACKTFAAPRQFTTLPDCEYKLYVLLKTQLRNYNGIAN